jgi:hypothetical protein
MIVICSTRPAPLVQSNNMEKYFTRLILFAIVSFNLLALLFHSVFHDLNNDLEFYFLVCDGNVLGGFD